MRKRALGCEVGLEGRVHTGPTQEHAPDKGKPEEGITFDFMRSLWA